MSAVLAAPSLPTQIHSRRAVLRLAGASVVSGIIATRLSRRAAAQIPYPTRIRVLHASPSLGKVEVLFNGEEKLDEFTYGTTSDWIEVKPGVVRVTVRRDRAGINSIVFDAIAPVVADEDYDLILSDPLVIPAPVDRSPLPADTARVQVIQASVDVPAIDVAIKGGDVLIDNLAYSQLSDPMEVAAGSYDLEVRIHGSAEVVLDLPGVVVEGGNVHHAVVYGTPGSESTPLAAAVLIDAVRSGAPAATAAATPVS